ncbi:hypothetical protein STCU_09954 [Strigomonas culicis]|uniref:Uncharacterized protein n=1 Tax=Strigomonas culicis TaxID=28005 RepID=S9V6C5_9TRYP|nr:hypothetical protein STCU_09954 [Strigomonas culicis]|eukprot:EPY18470.1 hypothetical protein STCU_09954 [Strigomonas culicis]
MRKETENRNMERSSDDSGREENREVRRHSDNQRKSGEQRRSAAHRRKKDQTNDMYVNNTVVGIKSHHRRQDHTDGEEGTTKVNVERSVTSSQRRKKDCSMDKYCIVSKEHQGSTRPKEVLCSAKAPRKRSGNKRGSVASCDNNTNSISTYEYKTTVDANRNWKEDREANQNANSNSIGKLVNNVDNTQRQLSRKMSDTTAETHPRLLSGNATAKDTEPNKMPYDPLTTSCADSYFDDFVGYRGSAELFQMSLSRSTSVLVVPDHRASGFKKHAASVSL